MITTGIDDRQRRKIHRRYSHFGFRSVVAREWLFLDGPSEQSGRQPEQGDAADTARRGGSW